MSVSDEVDFGVQAWQPVHDIPVTIQNDTGGILSVVVFMKNESSFSKGDKYVAWKVFHLSSPGSADFVYPKQSQIGVQCTNEEGVGRMVGPMDSRMGSTWKFRPPTEQRPNPVLDEVEDAPPTPHDSVLIINQYSLKALTLQFGLYKLKSMLLAQRNVLSGQLVHFIETASLHFAISPTQSLNSGDFIEDLAPFGKFLTVDLKDFPNGTKIVLTQDINTKRYSLQALQKY